MADALTHLMDACAALKFIADGASIAAPEIRLADERDGRALIGIINATDSARMLLTSPIDIKAHEFMLSGVKITWPQ